MIRRRTSGMELTLELLVDAVFFEAEQAMEAESLAVNTGGSVYS